MDPYAKLHDDISKLDFRREYEDASSRVEELLDKQNDLLTKLLAVIVDGYTPMEGVSVTVNLLCRMHAAMGIYCGVTMSDCCDNLHATIDYLYPLVFREEEGALHSERHS